MTNLFKPEVTSRKIGYTRSSPKIFEASLLGHQSDGCQSKEAALENLAQKIEGYAGSYNPEIVSWDKDNVMLVYRDGNCGWTYQTIVDHEGVRTSPICAMGHGDDKQTAIANAKYTLAQHIWNFEMGQDHPMLQPFTDWLTFQQRKELQRWIDFQMRYHIAKQHGMNDNDAHHYAGRFPGRPELLAKELEPVS